MKVRSLSRRPPSRGFIGQVEAHLPKPNSERVWFAKVVSAFIEFFLNALAQVFPHGHPGTTADP